MPPKHLHLYVASGTGNTLRVARWIGAQAQAQGVQAHVLPMRSGALTSAPPGSGPDEMVGLAAASHGFTAPWHAIKFALGLPRRPGTPAFVLATRASFHVAGLTLPGLSASCTFVLALILVLKGYRVRGAAAFDMPSNWFSLHPIQKRSNLEAVLAHTRPRVQRFASELLAGGRHWRLGHLLYEGTGALLLLWLSVAYLLAGRFFLAKLFFANGRCDGCGLCAASCPVRAIELWGRKAPRPYWTYACESCMRCATVCPRNAVEASQSWGVLVWLFTTIPFARWGLLALGRWVPALQGLEDGWVATALGWLSWYPAMFLSYLVLHLGSRLGPARWLLAHTTLTHYWGRYREPGTKRAELIEGRRTEGK